MKLSPQKRVIFDLHSDYEWHCSTAIEFIRDQRKRISEMIADGYLFESEPCDRRCGINHHARLLMRRLVSAPNTPPTKKVIIIDLPNGERVARYETN